MGSSSPNRDENQKYLKPPTQLSNIQHDQTSIPRDASDLPWIFVRVFQDVGSSNKRIYTPRNWTFRPRKNGWLKDDRFRIGIAEIFLGANCSGRTVQFLGRSWWNLNLIEKYAKWNWIISPNIRGENRKHVKPLPRLWFLGPLPPTSQQDNGFGFKHREQQHHVATPETLNQVKCVNNNLRTSLK